MYMSGTKRSHSFVRDVMEHLSQCGRPLTSSTEVNIATLKKIVIEYRHSSLREILTELYVSHESICTTLKQHLFMKHVAARLVSKKLNLLQKKESQ